MRKNIGVRMGAFAMACSLMLGAVPMNVYAQSEPRENQIKIGLLSDTHYFSKSLYSNCDDFTMALNSDRKMLKESDAILNAALNELVKDKPDFVLVSGDLTKDGEQINHEMLASKLAQAKKDLAQKGVDTNFYVINGNHDINNPNGKDFSSGHAEDADRTTVEEFKQIYKEFGYGEDSVQYAPNSNQGGSLSYVTRPEEGYTLIAVDSGKYSADQTASGKDLQETGGVISNDLLQWITEQARQAKQRGDIVMVVQHHGVVPHFGMEPTVMADYLVDNWQEVQQAYADSGVSYVFTGHMHANDISAYTSPNGNVLYDIETGSLLTYPSLMREAVIEKGTFANDKSSTIQVETKKPGVVHYTDFDTGEQKEITDITEYGKAHTLSNDVIKTMISEGLLRPMFKDALEQGGVKTILADLLGIEDYTQVSLVVANTLTQALPTDKENGLEVSVSGFTFKIYYDAQAEQIKISQAASNTVLEENVLRFQTEQGTTVEIEISQELAAELNAQVEALKVIPEEGSAENITTGLFDSIELFVEKSSVERFLDELLANVDQQLLAQPERVFSVLNTLLDNALNAKVDEGHTVFELVNYVYQTHLAGNEVCEAWAETVIEKVKNENLLSDILINAIKSTQSAVKEMLSVIPIDLNTFVQKGNNSITTNIAHSTVVGMVKNAGDIVDMVDLSELLTEELMTQIKDLAYNVAYSMTHDENFADDNKALIEISRMLNETILDAKAALQNAGKIAPQGYTTESYQNMKNAVQQLENAVAGADQQIIKAKIAEVNQAIADLQKNNTPIPTEKPNPQDSEQSHQQQNQPNQGQAESSGHQQTTENTQNGSSAAATKSVQTGDSINMFIVIAGVAAVLEAYLYVIKKRNV